MILFREIINKVTRNFVKDLSLFFREKNSIIFLNKSGEIRPFAEPILCPKHSAFLHFGAEISAVSHKGSHFRF
jgi:hypothetical protein